MGMEGDKSDYANWYGENNPDGGQSVSVKDMTACRFMWHINSNNNPQKLKC